MTTRTITIEFYDKGTFNVIQDGKETDELAWDEMLGTVAQLTHPKIGKSHYPMMTREEWQERERILFSSNHQEKKDV